MVEETVRYAVSLIGMMNLSKQPEHLPLYVLLRQIVTPTVIANDDRLGTEALVVRDDVGRERWDAIVQVVRMKFRPEQFPLYENSGSGWKRLRK